MTKLFWVVYKKPPSEVESRGNPARRGGLSKMEANSKKLN